MIRTQPIISDRLYFLDNLRYFLVILVVFLHAACSYSHYTPWWPVDDVNQSVFNVILRSLDIFLMPGLFFIAGYFALPSLAQENHSTPAFIKKKAFRLGIPFLIGVLLVGPIRMVIYNRSRRLELDLWTAFVQTLESALSFHTGFITSVYQFSHQHFWFISLLLAFFVCFALIHRFSRHLPLFFKTVPRAASGRSILVAITATALLSAVVTFFIHGLFARSANKAPWLVLGNLLMFQPTKAPLYLLNFCLGIYAWHRNWFSQGNVPGHWLAWLAATTVLWIAWEGTLVTFLQGFSMKLAMALVLIRPLLFFSILMTLISFSLRHWQSGSPLNRLLADNSYTVYLIHMVFVMVFQWLLYQWKFSVYAKFTLVFAASLFFSLLFSHFAIRKAPKIAAAGMILLFILIAAATKPPDQDRDGNGAVGLKTAAPGIQIMVMDAGLPDPAAYLTSIQRQGAGKPAEAAPLFKRP